jgi:hypothetical protein
MSKRPSEPPQPFKHAYKECANTCTEYYDTAECPVILLVVLLPWHLHVHSEEARDRREWKEGDGDHCEGFHDMIEPSLLLVEAGVDHGLVELID